MNSRDVALPGVISEASRFSHKSRLCQGTNHKKSKRASSMKLLHASSFPHFQLKGHNMRISMV